MGVLSLIGLCGCRQSTEHVLAQLLHYSSGLIILLTLDTLCEHLTDTD